MRIHLLLAAALVTASALASAEDKRYDPKALARYDVSFVRCEASFPEMKGRRDDAYMSLWRMKPGPKTTARLAEVRSSVRGPVDGAINTDYGGRMFYWNDPEGHQWELLTVSYARQPR